MRRGVSECCWPRPNQLEKKNCIVVTKEFSKNNNNDSKIVFTNKRDTKEKRERKRKKKLVVVGYYIDRLNRPIARQIQKEIFCFFVLW